MCQRVEELEKNYKFNIAYSYFLKVILLETFAVFLVNYTYRKPHDCFECFNRLSGVRYSSFQYTKYESNKNLEQRYGQGAVRIYEQLYQQALEEVERENE